MLGRVIKIQLKPLRCKFLTSFLFALSHGNTLFHTAQNLTCCYISSILLRCKMMLGLWLLSVPSLPWEPLLLLWNLRWHRKNIMEGFRHLILHSLISVVYLGWYSLLHLSRFKSSLEVRFTA